MSTDMEDYEELKLSFRCHRCQAKPGELCRDRRGRQAIYDHASRNEQAWFLIGLAVNPPTDLQLARAKRLAVEWERS